MNVRRCNCSSFIPSPSATASQSLARTFSTMAVTVHDGEADEEATDKSTWPGKIPAMFEADSRELNSPRRPRPHQGEEGGSGAVATVWAPAGTRLAACGRLAGVTSRAEDGPAIVTRC